MTHSYKVWRKPIQLAASLESQFLGSTLHLWPQHLIFLHLLNMIWLIFPLGNPLGIWGFYNREDVFLVGGLEHEFSDFPYFGL